MDVNPTTDPTEAKFVLETRVIVVLALVGGTAIHNAGNLLFGPRSITAEYSGDTK